jgi:hypothetical protein
MEIAQPASRRYWLNRALFDLDQPDNRAAFLADKDAYFARYPLNATERQLLSELRWQRLLDHGVLPNLVFRYFMIHGLDPTRFAEIVKADNHG